MDFKKITITQIVIDILALISFIADALVGRKLHPIIGLIWVVIALFAHIENYNWRPKA